MYCLSKDGLRMTEAIGFGIEQLRSPVKYEKNGETVFNSPGTEVYCILTNNGYLMDVFESEEDAKKIIREVMQALSNGIKSFEF